MHNKHHADTIAEVLTFWFEETDQEKWFIKDDTFDALLHERFEKLVRRALAGQLDQWAEDANGLLALIILLDQMTRNIFRDTPTAFAGDDMALGLTMTGLERGYLDQFDDQNYRHFLLMPMMHAEDLAVQEASLPLFEKYSNPRTYEYAIKHKVIIERFGHFPHRNKILGRPITAEEEEFLKGPDSSF
jgi:uncharacterized protein (DUF924 family)